MKPDRDPLASHQIHLVTVFGVCVSERVDRGVGRHPEPGRLRISNYFCLDTYKPTVSPLMIPLVYCHIKSFQRASSVEKPWPGGEKRRDGRAAHPVAWGGEGVVFPPVGAPGVSLIARGCLIGATPRGQPWTSAVTLPYRRNGLSARRMAVLYPFREPSLCRHVHREFM